MTYLKEYWRVLATRSLIAAFAWWVLSEGRHDSWIIGTIAIVLAVGASLWLAPPHRIEYARPQAALVLLGFFLVQSLRAGMQVAWLALSPRATIAPRSVEITLDLPEGPPRYLLAGTLSLLPGTLSVKLQGSQLLVHVLSGIGEVRDDVRALEVRIAPLFGSAS